MVAVHAGLNFEHDTGEIVVHLAGFGDGAGGLFHYLGVALATTWFWGDCAQRVQNLVHAEIQHRGGENQRRGHTLFE